MTKIFSLTVLLLLLSACGREDSKPNILLVVLDDFGYNDLALNNDSNSPTPTLDQIARDGIRFTRHYTESSCTPSRVALLTGMYPARVGAHPYLAGIDREWVTLPDRLGDNGYTNYMVGKWHAGDAHPEARPEAQGFHHWFGFMSQLYLKGPHDGGHYRRARPTYLNPWLETESEKPRQHQGHLTDLLTEHALGIIERERNPWFIYLSYYAPHTPIEPSEEFQELYPDGAAGKYQALKAQLDSNLKRLYDHLHASGQLANTMLIVVSDNGGNARSWPSNIPFEGAKATYSEGGIRTPLILHWPDQWAPGQLVEHTVAIFDIYPTILSALGLEKTTGLDGSEMLATNEGRSLKWYSHNFFWDAYSMLSADGRWRLINTGGKSKLLDYQSDSSTPSHVDAGSELAVPGQLMNEEMQSWIRSVTRVSGLEREIKGDWYHFTGAAFRRTPMTGNSTLGFTFQRGSAAEPESGQLVYQHGYINISHLGNTLKIEIDENTVNVELPPESPECLRLVVVNNMVKDDMIFYRKADPSRIWIYLNGEAVHSAEYFNPALSPESPSEPLKIQGASEKNWYMPPAASPFLSTRSLSAREISEMVDPELMNACSID